MLHTAFTGILNDKLHGFYRSTFTDDDGVEQVIATTQFEATDARRAFPCWDEPDFKAVFGVTLVVAADLTAVSNAAEVSRSPRDDGKHVVRFADTMTMSTYLVAFIVGPLDVTEPVDVDGTPLRIVYPGGKGHLTGYALEVGAFCLRFFADYFGIALPGRQARPRRRARLRLRRHGEPRLHHLPRGAACSSTPTRSPSPSCSGSPTSSPTSWPTCGSATSSP